jgi:hypothetical protein
MPTSLRNNIIQLVVVALIGAGAMAFWDRTVQANQERIIEKELAEQQQTPAVDIHKVGLHGAYCDLPASGLEPVRSASDEAKIEELDKQAEAVFSTPGGMYTADDIRKNGKEAPFARFHAFVYSYSMRALPKQYMDPVCGTRTSPIFNWYVGGQMYHFACVPTLEEFVMRAKKSTAPLPSPDSFIAPGTPICDEPDEDEKAQIKRNQDLKDQLKAKAGR